MKAVRPDLAIFALWATIQSWWQQLFYPNCPHCWAIFENVSKSFIFLVYTFLGKFYRHFAIYIWSHWVKAMDDAHRDLQILLLIATFIEIQKQNIFKCCSVIGIC